MGAHSSREAVTVAGKKWQCLSEIGEGRYAKIFMVKDLQDDQVYVVKRTIADKIDKPVSQQSREEKEEAMKIQSAMFEPHVLKALHPEYEVQAEDGTTRREKFHHPNIVNFHEFKKRKSKDNKQYEFLLRLECCPGGNLKQQLQLAGRQPWPIVAIMQCFSDICNAVAFLHQQNPPLAHRDLKLSNVLIDSSQNYKLCDFGSSSNETWNLSPMVSEKDIPNKIADMKHFVESQTTESYRAPEMLDLAKYRHVGVEADIWALGCILYELLFLKAPFGRPNDSQEALQEQQRNIKVAAFDIPSWASNYPKAVLNLLRAMLVADYRKRAKITDIVKAVRKILVEETRLVSNDVRPPRMQSRQPEGMSSATNSPNVGQSGQQAGHPSIFSRDLAKATTSRKLEAPKAKHMRRLIIAAWQQDDPVRACGALFTEICGNRSALTDVTVAYKTLITIHKLIQQGPPEILHECFRVRQFLQRIQFLSRSEGGKTFSRNETGSDVVPQTMQLYAAYLIQRANFHHDHPTIEGNFSIACHLYDIQRGDVQFSLDEWKEMARRAVEQMLKFLELLAQVGDRAMSAGAGSDKTLVDFRQSVVPPIVDDMYAIYLTVTYFLGLLRVVVGFKPVEELLKQYKRHFGMIRDFYATALEQCSPDVINANRLPPLPKAALKISSRTTAESTVVPLPSNVPNLAQMNMPLCDKFKKQLYQAGSLRRTHSRANSEFSGDLDPLGPQKRTPRVHHMDALRVDSPRVQTSSQNLGVREVRRTQTDPTRQRGGSVAHHAHAHTDAHHPNAYRQQQPRAQTQRSTSDNFLAFPNDAHHPHGQSPVGGGTHGQQGHGSRGTHLPLPRYDPINDLARAYTDPLNHRDAAARGRAGYGQKQPVPHFPEEEQSNRQEEAFKVFDDPEFNASFEQMPSNSHENQRRNHAEYNAPSSVWHPNFPVENAGDEQKGGYGGAHRRTDGGSMLATTSGDHEHDEAVVHLDSDDDELVWDDLELQDRIGIGGFAEVFKGRWLGADVAIKKLINQRQTPESLDEFRSEVAIMRRMQHPSITMFMGACTVPPYMCLVTELLEMSLFDLLHNTSIPLSWRIKAKIALGTARGLDFLHNCDPPILHRDLKSANILLDKHFEPRLADFGLSREKVMSTMTAQTGTFQWMSPEVIAGKRYTEKADVFSYGIILWELCVRKIPYEGKTGFQVSFDVVQNKARPELDYELCPPNWIKLMTSCWKEISEDRPPFERVVRIVKEMQLNYENA